MTLVGAIQIAHVPVLPGAIGYQRGQSYPPEMQGPLEELAQHFPDDGRLMDDMREAFVGFAPDVIVFFDADHLNTFFLDHAPSIAVGVDETTSGPSDHPYGHPHYDDIPVDRGLADAIHRGLVAREFDASRAQRFALDHSMTVPLHFLTPDMDVPVVPIWVNGLHGIPIRSTRARALGAAVREIVDETYPDKRVVLVSSGAYSLDIGTPRVFPHTVFGIPDPEWMARASALVDEGDLDTLVAEATPEQFVQAGNASAELLNVIAIMSALGEGARTPVRQELLPTVGHAYIVWNG